MSEYSVLPGATSLQRSTEENLHSTSNTNHLITVDSNIDSLLVELQASIKPGMDDEVQEILAELVVLTKYLRGMKSSEFIPQVRVAIAAVLSERPNTKTARIIVDYLSSEAVPGIPSPSVWVLLGLGSALAIGIPVAMFLFWLVVALFLAPYATGATTLMGAVSMILSQDVLPYYTQILLWAGIAGAIGSIISILIRVNEFERLRSTLLVSKYVLFFTGLFKPFIGAAFAMFLIIVILGGLIPLKVPEDSTVQSFLWLAVAFLAGFSERLAKDIASRTEEIIGGSK